MSRIIITRTVPTATLLRVFGDILVRVGTGDYGRNWSISPADGWESTTDRSAVLAVASEASGGLVNVNVTLDSLSLGLTGWAESLLNHPEDSSAADTADARAVRYGNWAWFTGSDVSLFYALNESCEALSFTA